MLQIISKTALSVRQALPGWKSILSAIALALFCLQSVSVAAEFGSRAPSFSLTSLAGDTVSLAPPPKGTLLVLYFFDPSDKSISMLVRLNDAVSKSSGALSLLAIARAAPDGLKASLAGREGLYPVVLNDNEGVTSAYGFRKKLPAAVIIGPGARVGAVLAPVSTADEILMSAADTFMSLMLPGQAERVYAAVSKDASDLEKVKLGDGYARMLAGDTADARRTFKSLTGGSSPVSFEAHAALGFLEFGQGRDGAALAACGRASGSGFAEYVMGLTNARAGQCQASSSLFGRATKGRFAFKWQEAVALGMSARMAEERAADRDALNLYKRATLLSPLNPTINANLLSYHRRKESFPAASRYVEIIKDVDPEDPLVMALVDEYEAEVEFKGNAAARKRLKKKLNTNPKRGAEAGGPRVVLVPDLAVTDCPFELSALPSAGAGVLRRSLEATGLFTAIPRHEMLAAAEQLGIPQKSLLKPKHLLKLARALSADLITLGEMGSHKSEYFINIRIAVAPSGEVLAVASERIRSVEEFAPVIQRSASQLKEKVAAHYGR